VLSVPKAASEDVDVTAVTEAGDAEIDLSDVPSIDGTAVGVVDEDLYSDLPTSSDETVHASGSIFDGDDDFADFPAPPVGDLTEQPTPLTAVSTPAGSRATPQAPEKAVEDEPLIIDRPGIAITDNDRPSTRKRRSPEDEKAALDSLSIPPGGLRSLLKVASPPSEKKPARYAASDAALERLRALVASGQLPLCGKRDGVNYVLATDIRTAAADIVLEDLIRSAKLPTVEAGGMIMVGIPD